MLDLRSLDEFWWVEAQSYYFNLVIHQIFQHRFFLFNYTIIYSWNINTEHDLIFFFYIRREVIVIAIIETMNKCFTNLPFPWKTQVLFSCKINAREWEQKQRGCGSDLTGKRCVAVLYVEQEQKKRAKLCRFWLYSQRKEKS